MKKTIVKSCCGGQKAYLFETPRAINRGDLPAFQQAGFSSPPHFEKAGLFYVVKPGLTATGSFGSTRLNVRASGAHAAHTLEVFEKLLEEVTREIK